MLSEASPTWSSPTRSSRSCQDSVKPCRAWARSPTIVKLRDGQRSSSICHSASVSSWASSTTMCANGPASRSGSALGSAPSSTRASRRSVLAQLGIISTSASSALEELVDDPVHLLAFGGDGRFVAALAAGRLGVAEALPRGVEERQVGHRPGLGVRALQRPDLVGLEPRRAQPQVGGHRPEVADEIGRLEQRPALVKAAASSRVLRQRPADSWSSRDLLVVELVDQDREQRLPDLVARLVVRRTGVG